MAYRILIVEDEKELAEILGEYLGLEGYKVKIANDGEEGLILAKEWKPDLIILDIMLPKIDGITICKRIRETQNIPILILSAKSGEMDKVICFGIGADDYITKPFSPMELVARVKANLRRSYNDSITRTEDLSIQYDSLLLRKDSYQALVDHQELNLTTKEFEMLYFLASHQNQVFSKEQIYENVWGMNEYGDISSVAVYIRRIREKFKYYEIDCIKTIWGVGYKFSM